MKYVWPILVLCLLPACTTPEERARQLQIQRQADQTACNSYGLQPGSESFANCLLQLDLDRRQEYRYRYAYPRYYGSFGYFMHR